MDNVGAAAATDSLRLQEEIHSLMLPETPSGGGGGGGGSSSFTALLGLPPKQAIELLHALPDPRVKPEPADSGSPSPRRPPKRKEPERTNAKPNGGKKGKSGEESRGGGDGGEEKLPYVHVRARRGQATDSHSLAERARREKINARMKLLQELVPGCSKISGTALVLDEIINHVQSLQKQVEFLSMRLAAVNPIFDVSALDSFLPSDDVRLAGGVGGGPALRLNGPLWGSQATVDGARRQHHQLWQADQATPQLSQQPLWTGDTHQYHHHHGALPLQIRLRNSSSSCEREPDEDGAVISGRM